MSERNWTQVLEEFGGIEGVAKAMLERRIPNTDLDLLNTHWIIEHALVLIWERLDVIAKQKK